MTDPAPSPPRPGPEIARLERLIGRWHTTGQTRDDPPVKIDFIDTYDWLPGGFFVEHRIDGHFGDQHSEGLEILGADKAGDYFARSFGSDGSEVLYRAALDGDVWRMQGETLRFEGRFADAGRRLAGRWDRKESGAWTPWMDIVLVKER